MTKLLAVSLMALAIPLAGATIPRPMLTRMSARLLEVIETQRTPTFRVATVETGVSGRRIYLFHGFQRDHRQFQNDALKPLTDGLRARGDELVYVDYPSVSPGYFRDGGATYCRAFRDWLATQERQRAKPRETILIGVSLGGWHSLVAADLADKVIVLKPVTDLGALDEFTGMKTPGCSLQKAKGLAIYSPGDPRVGDGTAMLKATGITMQRSAYEVHGVRQSDVWEALAYQ